MRGVALIKKRSDYFELLDAVQYLDIVQLRLYVYPGMQNHVSIDLSLNSEVLVKGQNLIKDLLFSSYIMFPYLFGYRSIAMHIMMRLMRKKTVNLTDGLIEDFSRKECIDANFKRLKNKYILRLLLSCSFYRADFCFNWSGVNVFSKSVKKIELDNIKSTYVNYHLDILDFRLDDTCYFECDVDSLRVGKKIRGKNLFINGEEQLNTAQLTAEELFLSNGSNKLIIYTPLSSLIVSALRFENVKTIFVDAEKKGAIQKNLSRSFDLLIKSDNRIKVI